MSRRSSLLAFALASASAATCFGDGQAPVAPKGQHHPLAISDVKEVLQDFDAPVAGKPATDVVIVSEGYDGKSRAAFLAKARQCAVSLRTTAAAAPMREVTTFNFYYVWVPSKDKGAPWRNEEPPHDTAFGAWQTKDGLATDDASVDRAVKHVAEGKNPTVSVVMIRLLTKREDVELEDRHVEPDDNKGPDDVRDISDTPQFTYVKLGHCRGKKAREVGRVRQVSIDMRAFVHEFGHARFGLDDEYSDFDADDSSPAASVTPESAAALAQFPNCTVDPTGARWRSLAPSLFEASGKIAHIEKGGSGLSSGVWHATAKCRMNQSRSQDFCPVCKAVILGANHALVPPDWVTPAPHSTVFLEVGANGLKRNGVHMSWEPKSGATVNCYHIELRKKGETKPIWKTDVEGHMTHGRLPVPDPGSYVLDIQAQGVALAEPADRSKKSSTTFEVEAGPGPGQPTHGITEKIPH
jgi:hypothetical protein